METYDVSDSVTLERSNSSEGKNVLDSRLSTLNKLIKKVNDTQTLEELEELFRSEETKEELKQLGKDLIKLDKEIKSVIGYKDGSLTVTYNIPETVKPYEWSLDAFAKKQELDVTWLPITLLNFEISLRKLEVVFHRKTTTEKKDGKDIKTTESYVSIQAFPDKKNTDETEETTTLQPGNSDPPEKPPEDSTAEANKDPFVTLGFGGKEVKKGDAKEEASKWFALGLSPNFSIYAKPGKQDGLDEVKLNVPLLNDIMLGFGDICLWYTKNPDLMHSNFVQASNKLFCLPDKIKEEGKKDRDPEGKDVKPGLWLGFNVYLGDKTKELKYQLTGKKSGDKEEEPSPPDQDQQSQSEEETTVTQSKSPVGSKDAWLKLGPVTLKKVAAALESKTKIVDGKETSVSVLALTPKIVVEAGDYGKIDFNGFVFLIEFKSIWSTINNGGNLWSLISFEFRGIGMELNIPPLEVKGALARKATDNEISYTGQLFIKLNTGGNSFKMCLLGAYFERRKKPPLKAFFGFGYLSFRMGDKGIPLDPFGLVDLSGVALGLGWHYKMTFPAIEDIKSFPLVQAALDEEESDDNDDDDAKDVFKSLEKYLQPEEGFFWLAIGVELVFVSQVRGYMLLIGQYNNGPSDIGLLGLFTFEKKIKSGGSDKYLIKLELVLMAYVSIVEERAELRAQITDASYILVKDCKITGSLAVCMWWGQSKHAGDWVVTLGGYHPHYKIPDHYPKESRIGISFAFKDLVQVTGEVYFAITRSVAMLGLRKRYSIDCGPLKAWFEWSVDLILFWDPFFIFAQAGIQIGASLTFWFFGTRTVSVSVSGQVDLWGPPFAGVVKLQVIGTSFTIRFGDENSQHPLPSAKSFPEFVESTLNTKAPISLPINDGVEKDLTTEKQASDYEYEYVVNPEELRFSIQTKIPVKNAAINRSGLQQNWNSEVGVVACAQNENEFSSKLEISITSGTGGAVDQSAFRIIPIKTIESIALWNPKGMTHTLWNPKGMTPTGVNDQGKIENVLEGFSLSAAAPRRGNQIGPMSVSSLIRNRITFTWPQISPQNAYTESPCITALKERINSDDTNLKRSRMLAAMQRQQAELRTTVHLDDTAQYADTFFLAEPVFNPLGQ